MQVAVVIPEWVTTLLPTSSLFPLSSLPPHLLSLWQKLPPIPFRIPKSFLVFPLFFHYSEWQLLPPLQAGLATGLALRVFSDLQL